MKNKATLFLIVVFLFGIRPFIFSQSEPEVVTDTTFDVEQERVSLPGETMGQKLESCLYWTVPQEKRRFPKMYQIFPSTVVKKGNTISSFKRGGSIQPAFEDGETIESYMSENEVQGLIIVQNDSIKFESYGVGCNAQTLWTSFSVAKSVTSMLLGIALKDGYLSLDDTLGKYISEVQGQDYSRVTVRELVTMTSGIDWNEDYADKKSDVAQMNLGFCEGQESHILTYMKNMKSAHTPGTFWNYSTGETGLLGILIQKATGKNLSEYLSEKIWKPWGMEFDAYWLADECSGLNTGGHGLSVSLRDYARLGMVMLKNGKRDYLDLFSKEWLANATQPLYKTRNGAGGYGYLWWVNPDGSYLAVGIFGQMIYVNPSKNMVIAQYAAWPKATSKDLSRQRAVLIRAVEKVL